VVTVGLLKDIGRRIAMLAGGRRFERDLDDEMRLHFELETARQIERGLSPADAPFAVWRCRRARPTRSSAGELSLSISWSCLSHTAMVTASWRSRYPRP
jgi:hypothetical protein